MINRIHILGASGSGTTTLANALGRHLNWECFDTDNFYWEPTNPPFRKKREIPERLRMLKENLDNNERWILSGSLCGWGDELIPYFDLVILLRIPHDVRMARLIERERERYGKEIEVGGSRHESHLEFIQWASQYDNGDMNTRSKALHYDWLSKLKCPVLRIEEDVDFEEKVKRVLEVIR